VCRPTVGVSQPKCVACQPDCALTEPNPVVCGSESVAFRPESVAFRPESVCGHPADAARRPKTVAFRSESVRCDRPLVAFEGNSVVMQPDPVVMRPESVVNDPDVGAMQPGLAVKQRNPDWNKPEFAACRRTRVLSKPTFVVNRSECALNRSGRGPSASGNVANRRDRVGTARTCDPTTQTIAPNPRNSVSITAFDEPTPRRRAASGCTCVAFRPHLAATVKVSVPNEPDFAPNTCSRVASACRVAVNALACGVSASDVAVNRHTYVANRCGLSSAARTSAAVRRSFVQFLCVLSSDPGKSIAEPEQIPCDTSRC
jgi:hypothetical protein